MPEPTNNHNNKQQPRPKKRAAPEPLDWRELASGPALRGLSDVLATPAEVSRDRAARRIAAADSVEVSAAVGVTPTVVEWRSVVVTPTVADVIAPDVTPTVGVTPTEGEIAAAEPWVDSAGLLYEAKKVRRVESALHSMTMGEERFYQAVWQAREAEGVKDEGPHAKTFSIGYDRLARLVRLDEKSVRQLIPKLVGKKILEVLAGEVSASRIGKTYRIFSCQEILERQRAAGLEYVVKKARGVEFVVRRSG